MSRRGGGELVNAADTHKVTAIDGIRSGDAGILAHEQGGDTHALGSQGPDLGSGIVNAGLPVVLPAERHFSAGEDLMAVVRTGIGE